MNVRVSDSAELDSLEIEVRLDTEHPGYGSQFISLFEGALRSIERQPRLHARTEDGPDEIETREVFIARFEYRVIFGFVSEELVEVIAIVHARKRPSSWVGRLSDWN